MPTRLDVSDGVTATVRWQAGQAVIRRAGQAGCVVRIEIASRLVLDSVG